MYHAGIRDFFQKRPKEKARPVADTSEDANDGVGRILFQTRGEAVHCSRITALSRKVAQHIILKTPFCKPFGGLEDEAIARTNRRIYEYEQVTTLNVKAIKDGNLMIEGLSLGETLL